MSKKALLRDSTEEKTVGKAAGSGTAGPRRRALVMEKSKPPDHHWEPRGTQTSARRRPKSMADILVDLTQAIGLERRRHRSARIEHLGPSAARAEEREGTLGVGVTTNGVQEVRSFDNTALQQGLTPRSGANSSNKQLDVAVQTTSKSRGEKFCTDVQARTTSDL